jgi:hypothetical protein
LRILNQSEDGGNKAIVEGCIMNDKQANQRGSVAKLHPVNTPPVDENTASMIDLLQEHLCLAREGKLRSLAVVSVSSDGSAIGTQWSCDPGDMASLIGKLTVLTHDLMAARK